AAFPASKPKSYTHRISALTRRALARQDDTDQIGRIPGPQLFHYPGPVYLYGARGNAEFTSGLLIGLAVGDQLQHLALARRELCKSPDFNLALSILNGGDMDVAAQGVAYRAHEPLGI